MKNTVSNIIIGAALCGIVVPPYTTQDVVTGQPSINRFLIDGREIKSKHHNKKKIKRKRK